MLIEDNPIWPNLTSVEKQYLKLKLDKQYTSQFETWVYASKELETILGNEKYIDLISLDFKTPSCIYEVEKLFEMHVRKGLFQRMYLENLLYSIINRDGNEVASLIECYDLYCRGYYFFEDLGLGLGLSLTFPSGVSQYNPNELLDLSKAEQEELVNKMYPEANKLAILALSWLQSEKIVPTGTKDEDLGRWEYTDYRSAEEKQSKIWIVTEIDEKTGTVRSKTNSLLTKIFK